MSDVIDQSHISSGQKQATEVLPPLKPRYTRLQKLVGIILLAIAINLLIFVLYYPWLMGFSLSNPASWFFFFFGALFGLVGLALIACAYLEILASFNPIPVMFVSDQSPRLASKLFLEWQFEGSTHRVTRLSVSIQGREEVRYRDDKSKRTESEIFFNQELLVTEDPNKFATGLVMIELPANTMHSMTLENNRIDWVIIVHARMKRWANLTEEYPIHVGPQRPPYDV